MTENPGEWERELVTKLATAALKEQRRARLWGIFFKLLTFAYISLILLLAIDWKGTDVAGGRKHTAMVEVNGIIAPGSDARAWWCASIRRAAARSRRRPSTTR
jgi:protease-4